MLYVFIQINIFTENFKCVQKLEVAFDSAYQRLGFPNKISLTLEALRPCLIVPLLFSGPLYGLYLSSSLPLQKHFTFQHDVLPFLATWQGIRNLIIVSHSPF